MKAKNHVEFNGYEARNKKEHVLGTDPALAAGDGGRTWWNSATGQFRGWDGSAAQTLTNLIERVTPTGALQASLANKEVTLSIVAASPTVPGTMSAVDKAKLDAATNANTPSTLVQRNASGDFSAGTITAALNGLAADSTLLQGETKAQIRDFNQTTGQRTALSAISDFNTAVRQNPLDLMAPPTSPVSLNSQRIASLADPVNAQDAATKNYVDSVATGLDPKGSVRFATTANLSANYANGSSGVGATLTATTNTAFPTTDGVTPALNNRVLVKNQSSQPQNGIYRITDLGSGSTPWVLTRVTDADQAAEVTPGMFTFVEEGTSLGRTGWVLSSTGVTTIGTTNLPFTQFSGAGTYIAGNGVSISGQSISVRPTTGRISVSGGTVDIDAAYVGQSSITTLGTIATGTWQGTAVGVAYGGTGANNAVSARINLGAATARFGDLPAGQSPVWNHGMGTTDVTSIQVVEKSTGAVVIVDPVIVDANNIRFDFGDAIAAGAYRASGVGIATA